MQNIPADFDGQLRLVLGNMNPARLISIFLRDAGMRDETEIPAEVRLRAPGQSVLIPGQNCGFFTTPILHCAVLDVRRLLQFFLVRIDDRSRQLMAVSGSRYPDDMLITDLGLS